MGTALAGHLQHFSTATGIQVEFRNLVQGRLPSDTELLVYRLVQEALINVRKHADARAVTVHMRTDGGQVCVSVADDGKGFDARRVESMRPGKSTNGGGMRLGLRSMRQRVEAAGGEMTISSIPGKGTTLSFRCPLAPAQAPLPQPSQEVLEAIPC